MKGEQDEALFKAEVLAKAKGMPAISAPVLASAPTAVSSTYASQLMAEHCEAPKFNYNNFMRDLNERIGKSSQSAAAQAVGGAVGLTGSEFQSYLMRERE